MLRASGLVLEEKAEWMDRRHVVRFKQLSAAERAELIRRQPLYGRIVCRCETVTRGEIVAALHSPLPPCSLDGVKRRCGAGMGRCQGGFAAHVCWRSLHARPGVRLNRSRRTEQEQRWLPAGQRRDSENGADAV